jgi:hypothetical protein
MPNSNSKNVYKFSYSILIIFSLFIISCSKDIIEKSLADQVSGIYNGVGINVGGTLVPMPIKTGDASLSVKIEVFKISDTKVDLKIELTEINAGKETKSVEDYSNLELSKNEQGNIVFAENSKQFASIENNQLIISFDLGGLETKIVALKQ